MLRTQDRFDMHAHNLSGGIWLISISWLTGILASHLLLYIIPPDSVSWMRALPQATVSIVGALFSYCLPLFIIAICVWLDHIFISLLYILFKGFLQGYTAVLCVLIYGDSGWLIWLLLNFSGLCVSALTLYVLYKVSLADISLKGIAVTYTCAALLIAVCNTFLINPYLTALFV